jgi:hypothetical protein
MKTRFLDYYKNISRILLQPIYSIGRFAYCIQKINNFLSVIIHYHEINFWKISLLTGIHGAIVILIVWGSIWWITAWWYCYTMMVLVTLLIIWHWCCTLLPYIARTTVSTISSYRHITIWHFIIYGIIVVLLFIKYGFGGGFIVRSSLISWWYFFFDSRRFAYIACSCLIYMMTSLVIWLDIQANYYAIYLYYFLVITVIISIVESFLEQYIQKKYTNNKKVKK